MAGNFSEDQKKFMNDVMFYMTTKTNFHFLKASQ